MADKTIPVLKVLRGNVGIGTNTPISLLDVTMVNSRRFLVNYDDSLITIKGGNNSGNPENLRLVADKLYFNTGTTGSGSEKMRIQADGNVGIGTTAPEYPLHISSADSAIYLVGSDQGRIILQDTGATSNSQAFDIVSKEDKLHFRRLNNGRDSVQATVMALSGDKVGIGTTAPGYQLEVNGNLDIIQAQGTGANAFFRATSDASTADWSFGADEMSVGANKFIIYDRVNSAYRMTIDNAGNVGINDTTPTYKLDVNGTFRATGDVTVGGGTLYIGSDCTIYRASANKLRTNDAFYFAGAIHDSNDSAGTSGQVLTSTGTVTDWKTLSEISGVDGSGTANYISKWTDGDTIGNSQIFDNGTTVGIGTNTFGSNSVLEIYKASGNHHLRIKAADNASCSIAFRNATGNEVYCGMFGEISGGINKFGIYNAGFRMAVDNTGKVGIGTTAPADLLHVYKGASGASVHGWDVMALEDNDNAALSILTPATKSGAIFFSDPGGANGQIVYSHVTNAFSFAPNATTGTKMTIDSAGKVGIGTATPAVKLHLDSGATTELRIDGEGHELITFHKSSAQKGLVGYSIGDSTLKLCAGSGTIASNVNGISINANGNVGIGTATPSAELHVKSPINQHCFLNIDTTTAAYNPVLELKEAGTRRAYINYVSASNYLSITTEESGSDIALMPLAGSVGIGTATPDTKLHVYYASPSPTMASITRANLDNLGILVEDSSLDNNNGEITCGITFGYVGESSSAIASVDEGGSGASGLGFVTGTIASVAERLRITNNGNVGIGTAVPAAMLEVIARASGGHPPLFLRRGATNESASLKLLTTTTEDWIVGMRNDGTSNFRIYSYGASSDVFSILRSNGNVGIGSATPAYALDVVGYAKVSLGIKVGGGSAGNSTNPAITVGSVNTAGVYFESSGVGFGSGSGTKKLFLKI